MLRPQYNIATQRRSRPLGDVIGNSTEILLDYDMRLIVLSVMAISSCAEELPLRSDPSDYISMSMQKTYVYPQPSAPRMISKPYVRFSIIVRNKYDDVLEDFAFLQGNISIRWTSESAQIPATILRTRNDKLGIGNLSYAKHYDRNTNKLTLMPDDSIVMTYEWNIKNDDSLLLTDVMDYNTDPHCLVYISSFNDVGNRKVSQPEYLETYIQLQLYQKTAIIFSPQYVFTNIFVAPNYGEISKCTPVNPGIVN